MTDAATEARWDHRRDLLKHEPRPSDPLPVDANTVALLARAHTTSFDEAVAIIQQFANTAAAKAAHQATRETGDLLLSALNAPLTREQPDAQG